MSGRRKWVEAEEEACRERFKKEMTLGIVPSKQAIQSVITTESRLNNRNWVQVKNWLRNNIEKNF